MMAIRQHLGSGSRRAAATGIAFAVGLGLASLTTSAQVPDEANADRLDLGTVINVRTTEAIDAQSNDGRVYSGMVEEDVRGADGRTAIPRGSVVELMVRTAPNSDLILDLDSIVVNSARFAVRTDPDRTEPQRDDSLVGSIIGAINGGQLRGRTVSVPRDSVIVFRLVRPLDCDTPDHGYMRDGVHYHGANQQVGTTGR